MPPIIGAAIRRMTSEPAPVDHMIGTKPMNITPTEAWPSQSPTIPTRGEQKLVEHAWEENAVVLGYDVHGKPWTWADETRVMQALVLGQTGTGKTTLLRNIITQDLMRRAGSSKNRHKIPMVIFDGKGDLEFFTSLLPYIHRAGRMADLRLMNPSPAGVLRPVQPLRL